MSPDARRAIAKVTAQPSPALQLLRELRRLGLRAYAYFEYPGGDSPGGWQEKISARADLTGTLYEYHDRWEALKDDIRILLRAERSLHEHFKLPYCQCGAVHDTIAQVRQVQSRPYDMSDPDAWRCITCYPELESKAYPESQDGRVEGVGAVVAPCVERRSTDGG